ncbi:selenium metabolism-associated LysR family transcriptional regulator [Desulfospira joergensenii]|uniref:selenium metabolism-associated LysR family transcriptional regulator n=1 Tax=Desulfospira joergensenii TaxID=53329 RepID=UPI0003B3BD88|nr:selenium metabolism-associated LysR family transcriptional regulator [Desulfospira joergensenii]
MDLWQLKIFVAVVDLQSFSKASETVNLSQPTVSTHIKELEDHFQCRLLDRLGKTTEPTKAGRILYKYSKQLLEIKDQTEVAMFDFLGQTRGELCIGGSTIPAGYILPRVMGPFMKAFPDVSLSLNTGDTHQIIHEVKRGRIELGIVGAKTEDPAIVQEKLLSDEMKLIVPCDHEWADKASVPCSELFTQAFISREKGSGTWQSILKSMDDGGYDSEKLKAGITMGSSIAVIQGILNHLGISILSTIAVEDYIQQKKLAALSVEGLDLNRFFYLTYHAKRVRSPICEKFIELAKARSKQQL